MIVAQQFTAGYEETELKSVKRTAEDAVTTKDFWFSVVRFTDSVAHFGHPTDESVGYYQPSAQGGLIELKRS